MASSILFLQRVWCSRPLGSYCCVSFASRISGTLFTPSPCLPHPCLPWYLILSRSAEARGLSTTCPPHRFRLAAHIISHDDQARREGASQIPHPQAKAQLTPHAHTPHRTNPPTADAYTNRRDGHVRVRLGCLSESRACPRDLKLPRPPPIGRAHMPKTSMPSIYRVQGRSHFTHSLVHHHPYHKFTDETG